ncbi:MAG: ferritin-like domain-containing protein [Gemmatimonadaceae bacterium]
MRPISLFNSFVPEMAERMPSKHGAAARGALPYAIADVLNFALTLEYLEAEFYQRGVGAPGLLPADVRPQFDQIRKHEVAHVEFLKQVLGPQAVGKPTFDYTGGMGKKTGPFADVFSNPVTFAAVAQAFEDTGVRAYKGQAANLMSDDAILQSALQVHSVEARHAAQVRHIRQQKGWITEDSRGNLPPVTQPIYNGEANKFHFILAQPSHGNSMSEAFDETLTSSQVLSIVAPFIAKPA